MSSGLPWFKLYTEARTDAKLRTLTDDEFRIWFNLLCFAAEQPERGVIKNYDEELLAIECNALPALLRVTLVTLTKLHIVSCTDDRVTFCAFARRQEAKPSDAPERIKARVAKHRAAKKQADVTPVTPHVTPRNAMKRLDVEEDRENSNRSVSPSGKVSINDDVEKTAAAATWNDISLSQTAERARSILHLPPRDLPNLKITLKQYPCAPPYLEGEAASCADWCAQHGKTATVAGFNRWLHRSERERLKDAETPAKAEKRQGQHGSTTEAAYDPEKDPELAERRRVAAELVHEFNTKSTA